MSAFNGAVDSEKDSKGRSHSSLGGGLRPALEFSFSINISYSTDFCIGTTRVVSLRLEKSKTFLKNFLVANAGTSEILVSC